MEQDIQDAVQYVNEIYHQNFENEDRLDDIMYQHLTNGNEAFIEGMFDNLTSEKALFFITMIKDLASIKGYVVGGDSIVSHLYSIPFIAIQDSKHTVNTFSKEDIERIEVLFAKHGISEKYDVTIFDTMLTPYGIPKEPIDINNAHDSVIFNSMPVPDMKNFSKGVSSFNKVVKDDEEFFKVNDSTFVLRYMVLSVKEPDIEDEGKESSLTEFVDSVDSDSFCEDLRVILTEYYEDILMAFTPIPYIDGVEIGIIEYNSMMVLHSFTPVIDSMGVDNLDIVVDHSEMGILKIMLVNKTQNMVMSEYEWSVPILTDSSVGHNIQYLQDLCSELGFSGYLVENKDNSATKTIH